MYTEIFSGSSTLIRASRVLITTTYEVSARVSKLLMLFSRVRILYLKMCVNSFNVILVKSLLHIMINKDKHVWEWKWKFECIYFQHTRIVASFSHGKIVRRGAGGRGGGGELPKEAHRSAQAIHVPYLLEKERSSIRTALESAPHLRAKNTSQKAPHASAKTQLLFEHFSSRRDACSEMVKVKF